MVGCRDSMFTPAEEIMKRPVDSFPALGLALICLIVLITADSGDAHSANWAKPHRLLPPWGQHSATAALDSVAAPGWVQWQPTEYRDQGRIAQMTPRVPRQSTSPRVTPPLAPTLTLPQLDSLPGVGLPPLPGPRLEPSLSSPPGHGFSPCYDNPDWDECKKKTIE